MFGVGPASMVGLIAVVFIVLSAMLEVCDFLGETFAVLGFNVLFLDCLLLPHAMWNPRLWYRLVIVTLVLQADVKNAIPARMKLSFFVKIFFMLLDV